MPKGVPRSKKIGGWRPGSGRKCKPIDWKQVENMLMAGCSGIQIAAVIGVHPMTLYERCKKDQKCDFTDFLCEKREKGNAALLGKQYEIAMKGDKTMLVWLGKNRCNQADKWESKIETNEQSIQIYLPDNGMKCEDT
ncbi:MAG TPA: hypothetical protein VKR53_05725 [Puia sp.]|nr:hypothetical protein [Puia sp.]